MAEIVSGAIFKEDAYAQGKMLDHSGWELPRGITPSDIDSVFANGRWMLFVEFSSAFYKWSTIKRGQRVLYEDLVKGSPLYFAVLARHRVNDWREQINTRDDVTHYQAMHCNSAGKLSVFPVIENDKHPWRQFVEGYYYKDPNSVLPFLRGLVE